MASGGPTSGGAPAGRRDEWICALLAGSAALPGLLATATLVVFVADWPREDDGPAQFGVGVAIGGLAWALLALTFCRGLTRPATANPAIHGELEVRIDEVGSRLAALKRRGEGLGALEEVREALDRLRGRLGLATERDRPRDEAADPCLAWLMGSGYVTGWREVHRVEELLLRLETPEVLSLTAVTDRARLKASSIEGGGALAPALDDLVDGTGTVARFDDALARELVVGARHVLNRHRNAIWEQLIDLRNRIFATMVFTGTVAYVILALAVVAEADEDAVTGAAGLYLVGAAVGLFAELYGGTRRRGGAVSDYGVGMVRMLATPVLSGIAAVGGVLLTSLGEATTGTTSTLAEVLDVGAHPASLIVAAVFGLTPGLLLGRLRARTEEFKEELERSGIGGEGAAGAQAATRPAPRA